MKMNSRFDKLVSIILEDLGAYEYENMVLAIVPGSFKPPHKGHWEMVEKYVDMVDKMTAKEGKTAGKVVVLVSNISETANLSRSLSLTNLKQLGKIREFYEKNLADDDDCSAAFEPAWEAIDAKAEGISYNELSDILMKAKDQCQKSTEAHKNAFFLKIDKYLASLKKNLTSSIRSTSSGKEITPEMSKEIFDIYAKAYGLEDKVEIYVSQTASPITDAMNFIEKCKDCTIILGCSTKGGDDARWNFITSPTEQEEAPLNDVKAIPVDVKTNLSATTLRDNIDNLERDWFPEKISEEDFNLIKDILN